MFAFAIDVRPPDTSAQQSSANAKTEETVAKNNKAAKRKARDYVGAALRVQSKNAPHTKIGISCWCGAFNLCVIPNNTGATQAIPHCRSVRPGTSVSKTPML